MSLTRCIKKLKGQLDTSDVAAVKAEARTYREEEGMNARDAGIMAAQDVLADLMATRKAAVAQIEEQGGKARARTEAAKAEMTRWMAAKADEAPYKSPYRTVDLSPEDYKKVGASYSGDKLGKNKMRKPVEVGGELYIASMWGGRGDGGGYRLIPEADWTGDAPYPHSETYPKYDAKGIAAEGKPHVGSWVAYRGKKYVIAEGVNFHLAEDVDVPIEGIEKQLKALADEQRGVPESMFKPSANPGVDNAAGLYQYALEHTGDLIHRSSITAGWQDAFVEKVRKLHKAAFNKYGFEREINEQITSNFSFYGEKPEYSPDADLSSLEAFKQQAIDAGKRYADEYRKLNPVTKLNGLSRDAAIALGDRNFDEYRLILDELLSIVDNTDDFPALRLELLKAKPEEVPTTYPPGGGAEFVLVRFSSGLTSKADLDAAMETGTAVGIDVGELTLAQLDSLGEKFVKAKTRDENFQLFIDSGAFSLFKKNLKSETAKELSWDNIFDRYEQILQSIHDAEIALAKSQDISYYDSPNMLDNGDLLMVMPDIVGDQAGTLKAIEEHADKIYKLWEQNQDVVIPYQSGEKTAAEFHEAVSKILNPASNKFPMSWIVGLPSNAEALPNDQLPGLLQGYHGISKIHILGASRGPRFESRIAALRTLLDPGGEYKITADSNTLRPEIEAGLTPEERKQRIDDVLNRDPQITAQRSQPDLITQADTLSSQDKLNLDDKIKELEDGYGVTGEQLELFPTEQKQAHLAGRVSADEVGSGFERSILGNKISEDFKETGFTSLLDQKISSPQDLAVLAQVYRNPNFETFRLFVTNSKGRVVYQTGVTSRVPGASDVYPQGETLDTFLDKLYKEAPRGNTVYLLHNHPSGSAKPSPADANITRKIANNLTLRGFKYGGHVVINHNEYSVIDSGGRYELVEKELNPAYDVNKAKKPHPMLDRVILSPRDVVPIAAESGANSNNIIIIGRGNNATGGRGVVRLVAEMTPAQLTGPRGPARLHQLALASGSIELFAANVPDSMIDQAVEAMRAGYIKDAINLDGQSLAMDFGIPLGDMWKSKKGRGVSEEGVPYALQEMEPNRRRAFYRAIQNIPNTAEFFQRANRLAGTPWAKQAIEGVITRQAIEDAMAGREIDYETTLLYPRAKRLLDVLQQYGEVGAWSYLERTSIVGNAEKPGDAINSSFHKCDPTDDCAIDCYAVRGHYAYASSINKSELITWSVEKDPVRAAQLAARQYKAVQPMWETKALRLFDKGDGDDTWIPFIKALNDEGVRVHVFSKNPEFIRKVPEQNLRLLSVDKSSWDKADANPDLPIAYVYSAKPGEAKWLTEREDRIRQTGGVILPIKHGDRVLSKAEIAAIPKSLRPHVCPIDTGVKMLPSAWGKLEKKGAPAKDVERAKRKSWQCTDCDKNGGVGCFFGATTSQVIKFTNLSNPSALEKRKREVMKELDDAFTARDEGRTKDLTKELLALLSEIRESANPNSAGNLHRELQQGNAEDGRGGQQSSKDADGKFARKQNAPGRGLSQKETVTYLSAKAGSGTVARLIQSGKLKIVLSSDPKLPKKVKGAIAAGETVYGFTDDDGTAYIVADNVTNAGRPTDGLEDAYGIYLHEVGTHHGMEKMLGPELFNQLKNEVKKAAASDKNTPLANAARRAYAQVMDSTDPNHKDEEALAWIVTDAANDKLPLYKRIWAAIKAFMAKLGFTGYLNPEDLVNLARGAANKAGGLREATASAFAAQADNMFYSPTLRAVQAAKQERMSPEQWMAHLRKNGAKKEELEWMGVTEFLEDASTRLKSIPRTFLEEFVRANTVVLEEELYSRTQSLTGVPAFEDLYWSNIDIEEDQDIDEEGLPEIVDADRADFDELDVPSYHYYVMTDPNGDFLRRSSDEEKVMSWETLEEAQDYLEAKWSGVGKYILVDPNGEFVRNGYGDILRFTDRDFAEMHVEEKIEEERNETEERTKAPRFDEHTEPGGWDSGELLLIYVSQDGDFEEGHYEEPNVLAHVRFKIRRMKDGGLTLFLEELQSDWHKAGQKEGYQSVTSEEEIKKKAEELKGGMTLEAYNTEWTVQALKRSHFSIPLADAFILTNVYFPMPSQQKLEASSEATWLNRNIYQTKEFAEKEAKRRNIFDAPTERWRWTRPMPSDEFWSVKRHEVGNGIYRVENRYTPEFVVRGGERPASFTALGSHSPDWFNTKAEAEADAKRRNEAKLIEADGFGSESDAHEYFTNAARWQLEGVGAVPNAPFKKGWPMLVMKRMIRWAVENGMDSVSWTNGAQNAARYNLASYVDSVHWQEDSGKFYYRSGISEEHVAGTYDAAQLDDLIGKEAAAALRSKEPVEDAATFKQVATGYIGAWRSLEGRELAVGGAGMRKFYDRMLVDATNKYVKKWGARVEVSPLTFSEEGPIPYDAQVPMLRITDEMRDSALEGQPLFARRTQEPTGPYDVTGEQEADLKFARRKLSQVIKDLKPKLPDHKATYQGRSKAMVDWLDSKMADPLRSLHDQATFKKERYLTMGRVAESQELARKVYDIFKNLDEKSGVQLYEYLTDVDATTQGMPTRLAAQAKHVKSMIQEVGQALVDAGVIPIESFEKYKGQYLPRIYLAYLLGDRAVAAVGTGKTLSSMDFTKHRNETLPQEYRDVILGEIKDPAFLASRALGVPLRDLAILEWLAKIAENQDWVLPGQLVEWTPPGLDTARKVTPFWLKSEAAKLRQRAAYYKGQNKKDAQQAANDMDELADKTLREADINGDDVPNEYRKIPDTAKYGMLRGIVVRREIYDDIVGIAGNLQETMTWTQHMFAYGGYGTKMTQTFKWAKVAANPPAQVRNLVSNWVLAYLGGVPMHRIMPLIGRAAGEIRKNGKYYKIIMKYGATHTTFAAHELIHIEREAKDMMRRQKGGVGFHTLTYWAGEVMSWTGDVYQKAEMLTKLMMVIDGMEREGKEEFEAVLTAQDWLFDYSNVGRNTRYLRNNPIGFPFITFTLKVLPRILEVAMLRPWKFLPFAGLIYGSWMLLQMLTGADDEDMEALELSLPSFIREKGHTLALPWLDEHGRYQFLDLGYFMPWAPWTEFAGKIGKQGKGLVSTGEVDELATLMTMNGLFGGPVVDLITALQTNVDAFTKRKIVDKQRQTVGQQWQAAITYLWGMMAPTWLVGVPPFHDQSTYRGAGGHLYEALSGVTDRHGDPKSTLGQALMRFMGMNIYGVEPEESSRRTALYMSYEIDKLEQVRRSVRRDKSLGAEEKADLLESYDAKIKRLRDARNEYRDKSQMSRALIDYQLKHQNVDKPDKTPNIGNLPAPNFLNALDQ